MHRLRRRPRPPHPAPAVAPLAVPCPTCKAPAGVPCVAAGGANVRGAVHRWRTRAAHVATLSAIVAARAAAPDSLADRRQHY